MSIQFGSSGYSFDVVNGLHKESVPIEDGFVGTLQSVMGNKQQGIDPRDNRTRFALHKPDRKNEHQALGLAIAGVVLIVLGIFVAHGFLRKALLILGGLGLIALVGAWIYWSQITMFDRVFTTNMSGFLELRDWDGAEETAKNMVGGWSVYKRPFIQYENKLRSVIISAKTLPPEMHDATCRWECVEFDDAHWEFLIEVGEANGVIPFFQKNLNEFAAAFGDPDRKVFRKIGTDPTGQWNQWQLILYAMPKDIHAGVSW